MKETTGDMSREFGSCCSGYLHSQMLYAAEDCKGGRDELTRLWGSFLEEFYPVAYEICSSEAFDSGPDAPIMETIRRLPALQERMRAIEAYVTLFARVAEEAVREALKEKQGDAAS